MMISIICASHDPAKFHENVAASLPLRDSAVEVILVETSSSLTVPQALNAGRAKARGKLLVFCHHDIVFPPKWIENLIDQVEIINRTHANWAIAGLFGVTAAGNYVGSVYEPKVRGRVGQLPATVQSIDELCIIMRAASPLEFDSRLGSHHFYGADLCLQARYYGLQAVVIDAPVTHLSAGKRDSEFIKTGQRLRQKWSLVDGAPDFIETTCGVFPLCYHLKGRLNANFHKLKRKVRLRANRMLSC